MKDLDRVAVTGVPASSWSVASCLLLQLVVANEGHDFSRFTEGRARSPVLAAVVATDDWFDCGESVEVPRSPP